MCITERAHAFWELLRIRDNAPARIPLLRAPPIVDVQVYVASIAQPGADKRVGDLLERRGVDALLERVKEPIVVQGTAPDGKGAKAPAGEAGKESAGKGSREPNAAARTKTKKKRKARKDEV